MKMVFQDPLRALLWLIVVLVVVSIIAFVLTAFLGGPHHEPPGTIHPAQTTP